METMDGVEGMNVEDTKAVLLIATSPELPKQNSIPIDQKTAKLM